VSREEHGERWIWTVCRSVGWEGATCSVTRRTRTALGVCRKTTKCRGGGAMSEQEGGKAVTTTIMSTTMKKTATMMRMATRITRI
jgi:hypothetical protein